MQQVREHMTKKESICVKPARQAQRDDTPVPATEREHSKLAHSWLPHCRSTGAAIL
jgi:hypothetical protein